MAPFQYVAPENRSANSIAALMLRPGEIEAQRAQAVANAQSQAAQASGQAWAGAIQNTGNAIAGTIQKATDPQQQMARRQVSDLSSIDKAFTQPGGRDAILASLPGHLRGQVAAQFASADESAAKVNEANLKAEAATTDYVTTLAEHIKAHDYSPTAAQLAFSHAKQTFASNPSLMNQVTQLEQQLQQNATPDGVKAIVDPILTAKDAQEKPVILPATPRGGAPAQLIKPSGGVVATGPAAPAQPPTEAELALKAAGGDAAKAMALLKPPPRPEAAQTKSVLLDGKPSELTWEPQTKQWQDASGAPIADAATRIKPIPPASATVNASLVPSGDALSMAARRYLATGELPAMGMGQAGAAARVAVMNEAAKIDPQASLAQNSATFKADSANLKNLQTTEGTLSAFESTAGKNLDQFLTLASKIPDTGVPWINQPIRTVNAKGLGDANQAAFNAARDVALREIARVTNDPKLAGVLSDSARQEVSQLSPQSATFAQIKAVATVLKQDMANVHSSLTQQITTAKAAIDQHPGASGGDVRQKAASVLSGAGKASDAGAIDAFLKNNPGFK